MAKSLLDQFLELTPEQQADAIAKLDDRTAREMANRAWWFTARPEQLPPSGDWGIWLIQAGRGFGKTRTGAEWLAQQVLDNPAAPDGTPSEWIIIGETLTDTRKVNVEGPSGFIRALARHENIEGDHFVYNKSTYVITFKTGQRIHILGADDADAGRGYNVMGIWADEIVKWPKAYETWVEGLSLALRIGKNPKAVVTTTPKANRLLIDWSKRTDGRIITTRGSMYDNIANLSPDAVAGFRAQYEGTRIGRQELYGELLTDIDGALWTGSNIEAARVTETPDLRRVVVAIDPSGGSSAGSDEQGIVVAGEGVDGQYYVLADRTTKLSPLGWAGVAIDAYREYQADRIVAEKNFGGEMVESTIRQVDANVPVRMVTASRGKTQRAEPIAAMYEQGKVHHVGVFTKLEEQMTTWTQTSGVSPDRVDALVWALTDLAFGASAGAWIDFMNKQSQPDTTEAAHEIELEVLSPEEARNAAFTKANTRKTGSNPWA